MNRGKAGHYNFSQRVKSINKSKIVFEVTGENFFNPWSIKLFEYEEVKQIAILAKEVEYQ